MDGNAAARRGMPPPHPGDRRRGQVRLPARALLEPRPASARQRHLPAQRGDRRGLGRQRLGAAARHRRGDPRPGRVRLLPRGGRPARRHRVGVPPALPLRPHPSRRLPRDVVPVLGHDRQLPRSGRGRRRHPAEARQAGGHQPVPGGLLAAQHRPAASARRHRPSGDPARGRHPALLLGAQRGAHAPEGGVVGALGHVQRAATDARLALAAAASAAHDPERAGARAGQPVPADAGSRPTGRPGWGSREPRGARNRGLREQQPRDVHADRQRRDRHVHPRGRTGGDRRGLRLPRGQPTGRRRAVPVARAAPDHADPEPRPRGGHRAACPSTAQRMGAARPVVVRARRARRARRAEAARRRREQRSRDRGLPPQQAARPARGALVPQPRDVQ